VEHRRDGRTQTVTCQFDDAHACSLLACDGRSWIGGYRGTVAELSARPRLWPISLAPRDRMGRRYRRGYCSGRRRHKFGRPTAAISVIHGCNHIVETPHCP
jgi:hypothetical protein